MKRMVSVLLFLSSCILLSACSSTTEKGILDIRLNLDDYNAETNPYNETISYTLTTQEILDGMDQPIKVNTIYNTDIYLMDITERVNSLNNKEEVIVEFGFDSIYREPKGTMLSLFRLNGNDTYTSTAQIMVFDEKGNPGHVGTGGGDTDDPKFDQTLGVIFFKEDLVNYSKWTFVMDDLHLLHYEKKDK